MQVLSVPPGISGRPRRTELDRTLITYCSFLLQKLQFGIFQAEQHLDSEEKQIIKRMRKELGQERSDDEESQEAELFEDEDDECPEQFDDAENDQQTSRNRMEDQNRRRNSDQADENRNDEDNDDDPIEKHMR